MNIYLDELAKNLSEQSLPGNYLFQNPLFNASLRSYGLSQDSYFKQGVRADFYLFDMQTGLGHINKSLDYITRDPNKVPLNLIEGVVNFCMLLNDEERNVETTPIV